MGDTNDSIERLRQTPFLKERQAIAVKHVSNNQARTTSTPNVQERQAMGAEIVIKRQPDPMLVSKPTVIGQIIAARINKQKAPEESRATEQKFEALAVKAVETPEPSKLCDKTGSSA